MANVLVIRRECGCKSCKNSKILKRWKNATLFPMDVTTLLDAVTGNATSELILSKLAENAISQIVLFVNLDCDILPEMAIQDLEDLPLVAERLESLCDIKGIFGVFHQDDYDEGSSHEQYCYIPQPQVG